MALPSCPTLLLLLLLLVFMQGGCSASLQAQLAVAAVIGGGQGLDGVVAPWQWTVPDARTLASGLDRRVSVYGCVDTPRTTRILANAFKCACHIQHVYYRSVTP